MKVITNPITLQIFIELRQNFTAIFVLTFSKFMAVNLDIYGSENSTFVALKT
jgi:hypothetical protein